MTTLELVPTPTAIDVMCGTGHRERQHTGNIRFNQIVSRFVEKYNQATSKSVKIEISKHILELLTESGVRFLKKCPVYQKWYIGGPKVGRDKIGHFLRLRRRNSSAHLHAGIRTSNNFLTQQNNVTIVSPNLVASSSPPWAPLSSTMVRFVSPFLADDEAPFASFPARPDNYPVFETDPPALLIEHFNSGGHHLSSDRSSPLCGMLRTSYNNETRASRQGGQTPYPRAAGTRRSLSPSHCWPGQDTTTTGKNTASHLASLLAFSFSMESNFEQQRESKCNLLDDEEGTIASAPTMEFAPFKDEDGMMRVLPIEGVDRRSNGPSCLPMCRCKRNEGDSLQSYFLDSSFDTPPFLDRNTGRGKNTENNEEEDVAGLHHHRGSSTRTRDVMDKELLADPDIAWLLKSWI